MSDVEFTFDVDTSVWDATAKRFESELGQDLEKVVREKLKSLLRRVVDLTPPTRGKNISAAEKGPTANKQGRSAIERDLRRAISPLGIDTKTIKMLTGGPDAIQGKASAGAKKLFGGNFKADNKRARLIARLKEVITNKDIAALRAIFQHLGRWSQAEIVPFSPSLHTAVRDSNGNVRHWQRKLTLDVDQWKAYQKQLLLRLGYAKSGYLKACQMMGLAQPKWVTRHGTGGGEAYDNLKNPLRPTFRFVNNSLKVPPARYNAILQAALDYEVSAMEREIDYMLDKVATKAGFRH